MMIDAPFRLRIRREGKSVNAYLAYPGPEERSVLMASMADGLMAHPDTLEDFTAFVKRALERGGFEFGESADLPNMSPAAHP